MAGRTRAESHRPLERRGAVAAALVERPASSTRASRRARRFGATLAIASFLLVPSASHATWELGLGIGGSFEGEYDTDAASFAAFGGYFQRIELDKFFNRYVGVGTYLNFGAPSSNPNGRVITVEWGLAFKPRLTFDELSDKVDFLVTPEFQIGYRGLFPEFGDASSGLGLNFGLDLRARFYNNVDLFIEPGFLAQPVGGNDATNLTFSPIAYLVIGLGTTF
jgi:hypothetical protein